MVYINYSVSNSTDYSIACQECGFTSGEAEDFLNLTGDMLCHSCYDDIVSDPDILYKEEEARKSRALADALNVDYLD